MITYKLAITTNNILFLGLISNHPGFMMSLYVFTLAKDPANKAARTVDLS